MPEAIPSDYFHGGKSEQFVFFKIPCQLITDPKFKHISTDAKLLYGMLLDCMSLSAKHGWYDDTGRVYIYYTVDEICGDMVCGRDQAIKLLAELDTNKGSGPAVWAGQSHDPARKETLREPDAAYKQAVAA